MDGDFHDRRARVLIAVITILVPLFLASAVPLAHTYRFRNGTYSDGRVITGLALQVVPGRPGEVRVEYFADTRRYEAWVNCGRSCPREGGQMEIEYSASDPANVVRNKKGPYSTLAIAGFLLTAFGIVISSVVLRRDLVHRRHRAIISSPGPTAAKLLPSSEKLGETMMHGSPQIDEGACSITFTCSTAILLHSTGKPRLSIDGGSVLALDWGTHVIRIAAGARRLKVWVPYVFPRQAGRAETSVTVLAGRVMDVDYVAPKIPFLKGYLGARGE